MHVAYGLYGRQPMNMPYLQLRNSSRGEIHATLYENWKYPSRGFSMYFMRINCIHTTVRGARICFQAIVLCRSNLVSGYDINTAADPEPLVGCSRGPIRAGVSLRLFGSSLLIIIPSFVNTHLKRAIAWAGSSSVCRVSDSRRDWHTFWSHWYL
jgi:hypothetical protein